MVKFAISGKANSGKNTTATLLGEELINFNKEIYKEFKIFGFADPMKEMILKMYPYTNPEILWGTSELRMTKIPGTDMTYRQLLMDIGKLGRSYNPNVWADATVSMSNQYAINGNISIISDLRFKNELRALEKDQFFLIRIKRPQNPNSFVSQDISEIDLDDIPDSQFDAVIINDSSLEELKSKIINIVNSDNIKNYLTKI
jgi:hypothetical protein